MDIELAFDTYVIRK